MDDFNWGQITGLLSALCGVFFSYKSWLMGIIMLLGAVIIIEFMH